MNSSSNPSLSLEIVRTLQQRVRQIEGTDNTTVEQIVSSGCVAFDRFLPRGGLRRGSLVEWLSASCGSGAGTLALMAAREASRAGGAIVVMDRKHWFYPPAAAALGVDLKNLILVRTTKEQDEMWALDQALRCPGVAAVWAPLDEKLDPRNFRRLQLAAESGTSIGLLLRPAKVRGQPSWSDLQISVTPRPSQNVDRRIVHVEILRCRGQIHNNVGVDLKLDRHQPQPLTHLRNV